MKENWVQGPGKLIIYPGKLVEFMITNWSVSTTVFLKASTACYICLRSSQRTKIQSVKLADKLTSFQLIILIFGRTLLIFRFLF